MFGKYTENTHHSTVICAMMMMMMIVLIASIAKELDDVSSCVCRAAKN